MLAEKKFKRKYCSTNAQNKNWYKTPDHFGAKMLSKMGWSEGKGLGANEQGDSEYVRVKQRTETYAGMGFDPASLNKVSYHMDNFNSVLSNLSVVTSSESKSSKTKSNKSTSEPSQSSKGPKALQSFDKVRRVKSCKRRLDNKILSNKKKKDLDIILGRANDVMHTIKTAKEADSVSKSEQIDCNNSEDELELAAKRPMFKQNSDVDSDKSVNKTDECFEQNSTSYQEYIYQSVSVNDYFKEKMNKRKKKLAESKKMTADGTTNEVEKED